MNCRENNEDNYFVNSIYANMCHRNEKFKKNFKDNKKNIFAVFDGLGGEEKGEEASFIAAKALKKYKSIEEYYKNHYHLQIPNLSLLYPKLFEKH